MSTATATHEERARAFATAVRASLSDLPADEVDELTEGLPSDLADRLADGGELGDPEQYASELRQAAGLPARTADALPVHRSLDDRLQSWGVRIASWWRATPTRIAISEFTLSLRPVWWILRGLGIASVVGVVFGWWVLTLPWMLVALGAMILSVQWGRGLWAKGTWATWLRRITSVVAVLALLPLAGIVTDRVASFASPVDEEPWVQPGLSSNGELVTNIFAYDCAGNPLTEVQLFTQDGRPLHTGDGDVGSYDGWIPLTGDAGEPRRNAAATMPDEWNVFPLRQFAGGGWESQEDEADYWEQPGETVKPPLQKASGLGDCDANAKPSDKDEDAVDAKPADG